MSRRATGTLIYDTRNPLPGCGHPHSSLGGQAGWGFGEVASAGRKLGAPRRGPLVSVAPPGRPAACARQGAR
jgi:hypothetical protein